jgi:glycosyltransferase involved in cell wall biosynthesis
MSSVLHIVQTPLDHVGGPATYVRELSKVLVKRGVKVGIVAPKSKNTKEIRELQGLGVEIYPVDNNPLLLPFLRAPWIFSIKAHRTIRDALSEYDVVNVHVESTFLQAVLSEFGKKKLITTIHGFPIHEDFEVLKQGFNFYRLLHFLFVSPQHVITLRKLIEKSNIVIALSNNLRYLVSSVLKINEAGGKQIIIRLPNGVDTDLFKPVNIDIARNVVLNLVKRKCGRHIENMHLILYLSRVDPVKRADVLIKALSRLRRKDWFLLLVGYIEQPKYLNYLKALAEKLDISENICFTGSIPHRLTPYFYSASYIYVLPSLFEGLPATVLEAMACKTPVIASKVGGVPEVVINGYNGILFSPGSIEELSEAIEYVLESPKARETLATRAYLTSQLYSWKYIAEKYYTMLFSIAH